MTYLNLRRVNLRLLSHRVIMKQAAIIRRACPSNHWQFRGASRFHNKLYL